MRGSEMHLPIGLLIEAFGSKKTIYHFIMDETQTPTPEATPTPAKTKTGVGKILAGIAKVVEAPVIFVENEAKALSRFYQQIEPETQALLTDVSKAVQVIKTTIGEQPAVVAYLLKKINPAFTSDQLNAGLIKVQSALNIAQSIEAPTLEDTIANLQAHVGTLTDVTASNTLWTTVFNVLGIVFSPGTPWGKLIALGQYIYATFIQPKA